MLTRLPTEIKCQNEEKSGADDGWFNAVIPAQSDHMAAPNMTFWPHFLRRTVGVAVIDNRQQLDRGLRHPPFWGCAALASYLCFLLGKIKRKIMTLLLGFLKGVAGL
ncbi:hypothetical protein BKP64_09000 [Marinobacter salinus]|uniref:Uncharacterized protein n=1 Tax=Marinobacter salinus TaxID=1874317 RepID=A0A1D9GLP0_9GAMM|nr:hypothetical protein BKP64_09000 [Marinobacter salinus]